MTNREILFIIRMRNDARAALQSLSADLQRVARDAANTARELSNVARASRDMQAAASQAAQAVRATDVAQANGITTTERMAAVRDRATQASRAMTRQLESEAQAQARISAMVARSVDAQEERNAAMGATGPLTPAVGAGAGPGSKPAMQQNINPTTRIVNAAGNAIGAEAAVASAAVAKATADAEKVAVASGGRIKNSLLGAYDAARDAVMHWGSTAGKSAADAASFVQQYGETARDVEKVGIAAEKTAAKFHLGSGAIRESVVLARELGRGDFSRMAGSTSILLTQLGLLETVLPVVIAGMAGLFLVHKELNTEAEKTSLTNYANSLGLTSKEMRKLKDETVGANGEIKKHNDLQVTYVDTIVGIWDTVKEAIHNAYDVPWIKATVDLIVTMFKDLVSSIGQFCNLIAKLIYTAFAGTIRAVIAAWNDFPSALGDIFFSAVNLAIGAINKLIQMAINGVNWFLDKANGILASAGFGQVFQRVGEHDIPVLENRFAGAAGRMGQHMGDAFKKSWGEYDKAGNWVMDHIASNADKHARGRIKEAADAIKANRNPKTGRGSSGAKTDAEKESDFWSKLADNTDEAGMSTLDAEIKKQKSALEEILSVNNKIVNLDDDKVRMAKLVALVTDKIGNALAKQYDLAHDAADRDYRAKLSGLSLDERSLAIMEAKNKAIAEAQKAGFYKDGKVTDAGRAHGVDTDIARAGTDAAKAWDVTKGASLVAGLVSAYAGFNDKLSKNAALQRELAALEAMRTQDGAAFAQVLASLGINQDIYNAAQARARSLLEANNSFMGQARKGLIQFGIELENTALTGADVWKNAFKGASDGLAEFITTGKFNFSGFINSIIADLARLALQQTLLSGLKSIFPGLGFGLGVFHTGGITGGNAPSTSVVSPSVFAGARRFHVGGIPGVNAGEVPVIAKAGEAIFPTMRMADGNFGVKALLPKGGMGGDGQVIHFAPQVSITMQGDVHDPKAAGAEISQQTVKALEGLVKRQLANELRSGGILSKR